MTEGELVVVLGKIDTRAVEVRRDDLIIGTFIGSLSGSKVQVLLLNGLIFTGHVREIALESDQR